MPVLGCQGFDLDSEPGGLAQVGADGNHAVVTKQAGQAIFEGLDDGIGQLLSAPGDVGDAGMVTAGAAATM